jgi:hypothetical protein
MTRSSLQVGFFPCPLRIPSPPRRSAFPYYVVETVKVDGVPEPVLRSAVEAVRAIGDGLYSVDIKQREGEALVIEVNDNPSLEHGEDCLFPEVYSRVIERLMGGSVATGPS